MGNLINLFVTAFILYRALKSFKFIDNSFKNLEYFNKNSTKTNAKITNIIEIKEVFNTRFNHLELEVEYLIGEKKIVTSAPHSMGNYKVGDSIDIFYNNHNFNDIRFTLKGKKMLYFFKYLIYILCISSSIYIVDLCIDFLKIKG